MKYAHERWFRIAVIGGATVLIALVFGVVSYVNSGTPGVAPSASSSGPARTCLDGTRVTGSQTCTDLRSSEVMFAVAGVAPDQCTAEQEYTWNAPGQSFSCIVGTDEFHVARYRNAAAKADRLTAYGECVRLDGGWKLCGENPENGRYVRAYTADDLLFYISSKKRKALLKLDAAPDTVVRNGRSASSTPTASLPSP